MPSRARKCKTAKLREGKGRRRGLTNAQYYVAYRLVRAGKTTWEQLERKGLVLPPRRGSGFRAEVERMLSN